jgi:4-carboxymuconolactone decarboxylase
MAEAQGSGGRSETFDRGLALIRKMGGQERPAVLDLFASIGETAFGEQCVEFVYGGIYHRPGLAPPERQLATIGALTALGYAASQLRFHAKAAVNLGCTRQQVIEAIIQVSSYTGFPAVLNALMSVKEEFADSADADQSAEDADEPRWSDIDDRYERGLTAMNAIDGEAGAKVVEALRDVAPDLARCIIEFTFGEIYPRPRLSLKHREIVSIAALTSLGSAIPQLKVHVNGLLNVGGNQREVTETLLHLAFYVGFPAVLNAISAAREVFAERETDQ